MRNKIFAGILVIGIVLFSGCIGERTETTTTTLKPETHPEYCELDSDCGWVSCCSYGYKCMRKDALSCPDEIICLAYSEPMPSEPCVCINNRCTVQSGKEVTITTDKEEYKQGETVKITVKNNFDNSIWYLNGHSGCSDKNKSYTTYRLVNGTWKDVSPHVMCIQIVGAGLPIYKELTPSASTEFIWDQKIWSAVNGTLQAPDGKYKISVKYKESKEVEDLKEVYSNEFTIKEKEGKISRDYCIKDSDCIPEQCCHPTSCVNKEFAPDCSGIGCTMVCQGPIDCGAGKCVCKDNKCVVESTKTW